MKKFTSLLVFLLWGSTLCVFSQKQTVTGTVTDASNNEPLPGVTVIVEGTTTGTITDTDGKFSLSVNPNSSLSFSYVGYVNEVVPVGDQTVFNLALTPDITALSEVVVVGYGSMERSNVTGAISTLKTDEIMKTPVVNPLEALRGQVAGVRVSRGSGMPGQGDLDILIRGKKSFSSGNDPIVVIDGVPTTGGNLAEINPADIESMNVLKDAAAASIYGASAANGVILITTKNGTKGAPTITLNVSAGPTSLIQEPTMFNGEEYYQFKRQAFIHQHFHDDGVMLDPTVEEVLTDAVELENYNAGNQINWHDVLLKKGSQQNYGLSVSGGTDKFKYYMNGNAYLEDGIVQYSDYKRYSFRMNADYSATKYLTVGTKVQVSQSSADETGNTLYNGASDFTDFIANTPLGRIYNQNNQLVPTVKGDQFQYNPLFRYSQSEVDRYADRFYFSPYVEINILEGLKYRMNGFVEKRIDDFKSFQSSLFRTSTIGEEPGNNLLEFRNVDHTSYLLDNILSFNKTFGKHSLDLTAVYGVQYYERDSSYVQAEGANTDLLSYYALNSATNPNTTVRLYPNEVANVYQVGRIGYAYDQRYILTLTGRRDGSSNFGEANKYGFFPSISIAWNLNNEAFMQNISQIGLMKLRLSYGTMGKDKIDPRNALALTSDASYAFNGAVLTGKTTGTASNKNLRWEKSRQYNGGLDFGLLQQRITGTIDIYKTFNTDLILLENIPVVYGASTVLSNVGETENSGFEASVDFKIINNNDFKWSVYVSGARDRNKIVKLNRASSDSLGNPIDDVANGWFIGQDIDVIYDYKFVGIYQNGEEAIATAMHPDIYAYGAGDPKIADISGPNGTPDGIITFEDQTFLGSPNPNWYGGIRNTISYKGLELTVLVETVQGVKKVNTFVNSTLTARDNTVKVNYWTPTNPSNEFPWPHATAGYYYSNAVRLVDASFVAIRNVSLTYTLPRSILAKTPIKSASIYAQGNNLKYFSDLDQCYTPEGSFGGFPMIKTWIFGTNITF